MLLVVLGVQSFGMLLGGYRRVELSSIENFGKYEEVLGSLNNFLSEEYKLSSLSSNQLELVCGMRQLVNGLNYKAYFSVGTSAKNDLQCEVKWYTSFRGEMDEPSVKCSRSPSKLQSCLDMTAPGSHRGRRSLNAQNSYPHRVTMKKGENFEGIESLFHVFNFHFNRTYSAGDSELFQKKFETFSENWKLVQHLNKIERGSATYGMTKFMDYTTEEFKKFFAPGFSKQLVDTPKLADVSLLKATPMPDSVDWRKKGAVTPVKNQGECGSCWAFSTTGNVEGQWFKKTGKLVSLSEQELVDCDTLDDGCEGGLPSNAYKTIEKLGGLETETDYPYDGRDEKCNLQKSKLNVYVNDSVTLPTDETQIATWLATNGPVSIGINANLMQFYWGGISHPWKIFCNPKSLDHGVLIVGYGTEDDKPYWIIKNSWGPDWGEEGYYRIYRGDGSCGVNQMATSSIIN